jgi:hypothetical protein
MHAQGEKVDGTLTPVAVARVARPSLITRVGSYTTASPTYLTSVTFILRDSLHQSTKQQLLFRFYSLPDLCSILTISFRGKTSSISMEAV